MLLAAGTRVIFMSKRLLWRVAAICCAVAGIAALQINGNFLCSLIGYGLGLCAYFIVLRILDERVRFW